MGVAFLKVSELLTQRSDFFFGFELGIEQLNIASVFN